MSSGSPAGELSIGIAHADITPSPGVTLAGYRPRISTSVAHPLRAEAVACSSAGESWLILASDILGIELTQTRKIRERLTATTGLPADAIAVCGTHTHSGPATVLGRQEPTEADRLYAERLCETLVALGGKAVADSSPASLCSAAGNAPNLGSNRRVRREDGLWENEWRDPQGLHPGFFDPTLLCLAVHDAQGARRAVLVSYGVHPVVLGPESTAISPDYPGYAKAEIESCSPETTASFLLSGAGNINPRVCIEREQQPARDMGRSLARAVQELLKTSRPISGTPVRSIRTAWEIRRTRNAYKGSGGPGSRAGDRILTELQAFRAGDAVLVFIPGELFSELAGEIRGMLPGMFPLVVTLANDYVGYLPTDEAQAEGAYETLMAPAEGIARDLTENVRALLARLTE